MDKNLAKNSLDHYEQKLQTRRDARRDKVDDYEKRLKRRDTYQQDAEDRREKRDNTVYYDGVNYTIRWTCMPRSVIYKW